MINEISLVLSQKSQYFLANTNVKQTAIKCLMVASVIGIVGALLGLLQGWREFNERGIAEYGEYQDLRQNTVHYQIPPENEQAYALYREQTKDDLTLYLAKGAIREMGVVQICLGLALTADYYRGFLIKISNPMLFIGYMACAGIVVISNSLLDKSLQQLLGLRYS